MPVELPELYFEIFKDEALKWRDLFGLKDWEILFSFRHIENFDQARCYANVEGKICTLELARWHAEACTEEDIRKSAFMRSVNFC